MSPSAFPKKLICWRLAERDGGWKCRYCEKPLVPIGAEDLSDYFGMALPTVEHLPPRSRGGTDALDNLALACARCNATKRALTEDEYRAWLAARA